jgi:signal peptidase
MPSACCELEPLTRFRHKMTDFPIPGVELPPAIARDFRSRELDQVQATVQALQGAASLLQGAMEQRQELLTEMRTAHESLAALRLERAQAEQALLSATNQLDRAAREVAQVRAEQNGVVAEFDKLVQSALQRRSALVTEIADLERQRDALTTFAPLTPVSPPPPPIITQPTLPEWPPVVNAWVPASPLPAEAAPAPPAVPLAVEPLAPVAPIVDAEAAAPVAPIVVAPTPQAPAHLRPVFATDPIPAVTATVVPVRSKAANRFGLRELCTAFIAVMLVGLALLLTPVLQVFGGTQLLAVMSGSMEPTIQVGGIVSVRPVPVSELQVGNVITFATQSNPDVLVTHRIVALEARDNQTLVTTKGDANDSVDAVAVPVSRAVGRVDFTLPWLGYLMVWLASPLAKVGIVVISVIGFALPSTKRNAARAELSEPEPATPARHTEPRPIFAAAPTPSYAALEREIESLLPRAS